MCIRDSSYIGELNVEYQSISNENPSQNSVSLGSHFIVGGQIKGQDPNLMLVYPEGNHIYMSDDQPYLQIGETKYGKPILDRMIHQDTSIGDSKSSPTFFGFNYEVRSNCRPTH